MFSILGAAFSWLTGNSNAANSAVDAVVDTVDKLNFTDQEKDVSNHKILDFKIRYAEATQNQSIARRVIAFGLTFLFVLFVLIVAITAAFDRTDSSYSFFIFGILKDVISEPFGYAVVFYFLPHLASKFKK